MTTNVTDSNGGYRGLDSDHRRLYTNNTSQRGALKALHPGGTFDTASLTAHIFLVMKRQTHLSMHIDP